MSLWLEFRRVSKIEEVWEIKHGGEEFKVIFARRTDPSIEEVSGALGWRVKELGLEEEVYVMVYPDGRGQGYEMKRFNDRAEIDFSRIEQESDVRFAHARGFIAKVEAAGLDRFNELIVKLIV